MKTVLMATKRGTGEQVMLMGPEKSITEQMAERDRLFRVGSEEYELAEPCYLTPCKPAVKLPLPPRRKPSNRNNPNP
jgi:hypothetical protein